MSWSSWIPRIVGYAAAPFTGGASIAIGEGIAQGIGNKQALDKAKGEQQAATLEAQKQQQLANMASGDTLTQQRADAQNLFGQPYQTLGGLLGMNIAPIGAPTGTVMTSAAPTGMPAGLVTGRTPQVQPAWMPQTPSDLSGGGLRGGTLASLAMQATPANAKSKAQSGYARRA
jgi:hypothetical protein